MFNERFHEAAQRVLAEDESADAARALQQVVLEDYGDDDRFADLREALARYAPDPVTPDVEAAKLRTVIRETLGAEETGAPPDET